MKIKIPYTIGDRVMTSGRVQSNINCISGLFINNEVKHLVFSTSEVSRLRANDIKKFDEILESDYKTLEFASPYEIGQEVLYQNSTYGNVGILAKGKIIGIEFSIGQGYRLFWYIIDNKKGSNIDCYNIYKDKESFIKRTSPKVQLKEGERFFFTRYCIQQNNLVPKRIIERTDVHTVIDNGGHEEIRSSQLYTSEEKFYNTMFAQL